MDGHARDDPGDGYPDPSAAVRGPEDGPVPDVVAAVNAVVVSDADIVACFPEELHVATPRPDSSPHLEKVDGPDCNFHMEAMGHGEATVWCSPGQMNGPCPSGPPVGLVTDGVSGPTAPLSPASSPQREEPPYLSMAAPSGPVPSPAHPAHDEEVGLGPDNPLQDDAGESPSGPVLPAALPRQVRRLEPDSLRVYSR